MFLAGEFAMLDEAAFRRCICESPHDDGPRLVFADWLEERGETGRAELIRVQCELAVLTAHEPTREPTHSPRVVEMEAARAAWAARVAALKRRSRQLLEAAAARRGPVPAGWEFRRGFIEAVRLHLADVAVPAKLARLFGREPVTRVQVFGASPLRVRPAGRTPLAWFWRTGGGPKRQRNELPPHVFAKLTERPDEMEYRAYASAREAVDDLSRAVVLAGRDLVELPPCKGV
jgi:uncharacterized protein (TIGR02996 family)